MKTESRPVVRKDPVEFFIHKIPRPYRRELVTAIQNLEDTLSISQASSVTWLEALHRYRDYKAADGKENLAALIGLLAPDVLQHAKELDAAFQRIHGFDPNEFMTPGIRAAAARFARKGHINEDRARAKQMLLEERYLDAKRGDKKRIKDQIGEKCSQSSRQMDILIRELKGAE